MATKIKAVAESKAPLCYHFTIYRQIYQPSTLPLLNLIISTAPLALCQEIHICTCHYSKQVLTLLIVEFSEDYQKQSSDVE